MDLKKYYEEFRDALMHAFPSPSDLEQALKFDLDITLDHVVGAGSYRERTFELIKHLDSEGRVDELFAAALKRKPGNPKLKAIASKIAAEAKVQHKQLAEQLTREFGENLDDRIAPEALNEILTNSALSTNSGLQALVTRVPNLETGQKVGAWEELMKVSKTRVCAISGKRNGTGFLVGENRIITNEHVIADGENLDEFELVFDLRDGVDRQSLPKFKPANRLAMSVRTELDYTIVELDRVPDETTDGPRDYFKVRPRGFVMHDPVSILGHPNNDPIRFSFGVVLSLHGFMGRVAYTANTAGGMSGSPVFTENWDLVAMHHHGEVDMNNNGIPMKNILKHLNDNGNSGLIEVAPHPNL